MGSVGRVSVSIRIHTREPQVFGALFNKLGVPIPTQIAPKVLAVARELVEGRATPEHACRELLPGTVVDGRVQKQEPNFYKIRLTEKDERDGVMIICRSPSFSKFKLILFDKEGAVRQIEVGSL
jgi:hypothetical protein